MLDVGDERRRELRRRYPDGPTLVIDPVDAQWLTFQVGANEHQIDGVARLHLRLKVILDFPGIVAEEVRPSGGDRFDVVGEELDLRDPLRLEVGANPSPAFLVFAAESAAVRLVDRVQLLAGPRHRDVQQPGIVEFVVPGLIETAEKHDVPLEALCSVHRRDHDRRHRRLDQFLGQCGRPRPRRKHADTHIPRAQSLSSLGGAPSRVGAGMASRESFQAILEYRPADGWEWVAAEGRGQPGGNRAVVGSRLQKVRDLCVAQGP